MAVTHIFYFMLCQSSLLSTVISFVYKDKLWFDESMSVFFCMENTWKEFFYSPSTLILHWIKLENFVLQLKRQSVEAWQNEKHYSKGNKTSESSIPRHKKFSNQSTKVRSGQVSFWKIEVYHLMLNDMPNVMTELAPKGPRFVEIIEIMDWLDIPFVGTFKNASQGHGWQFANSWIHILIIHWSLFGHL